MRKLDPIFGQTFRAADSGRGGCGLVLAGAAILLTSGSCTLFMGILATYYGLLPIVLVIGGPTMLIGAALMVQGGGARREPPSYFQTVIGWTLLGAIVLIAALAGLSFVISATSSRGEEQWGAPSYLWDQLGPTALVALVVYAFPLYVLAQGLLRGDPQRGEEE